MPTIHENKVKLNSIISKHLIDNLGLTYEDVEPLYDQVSQTIDLIYEAAREDSKELNNKLHRRAQKRESYELKLEQKIARLTRQLNAHMDLFIKNEENHRKIINKLKILIKELPFYLKILMPKAVKDAFHL